MSRTCCRSASRCYVPARESLRRCIASPGALLVLLIAATAALDGGRGRYSAGLRRRRRSAALGAAIAYFVQGKGWVYQAVPAAMFATLAGGFALEGERRRGSACRRRGLAAASRRRCLHNLGLGWVVGLVAGLRGRRGAGAR